MSMTPEEVIKKIADIADAIAAQAGVGGVETAGNLISHLAAHPEKITGLLDGTLDLIEDQEILLNSGSGCLTWHAQNGRIVSPAEYREQAKKARV